MGDDRRPLFIGVGPGLRGAIAALRGDLLEIQDMPVTYGFMSEQDRVDAAILAAELRRLARVGPHPVVDRPELVVVEEQRAMPGQGAHSTFSAGQSFGVVLGVVAALGWPIEVVAATRWKRRLPGEDKGAARRRAGEVFPQHAHLWARVRDDGRAEAALLAWHGRTTR